MEFPAVGARASASAAPPLSPPLGVLEFAFQCTGADSLTYRWMVR